MVIIAVTVMLMYTHGVLCSTSCQDDLEKLVTSPVIEVREHAIAGEVIRNITTSTELTSNDLPSFLKIVNGTIVTRENITVDGEENQNLCQIITNLQNFNLFCTGNQQPIPMIFSFKPTDDFEPVLPDTLLTGINVSERTAYGTVLLNFLSATYGATDKDCKQPQIQAIYSLASSMEKMVAMKDNSVLYLVGDLDYESLSESTAGREAKYSVGILAMTTVDQSNYKSTTRNLIINVIDVDDERPVFDDIVVKLHVNESTDLSSMWLKSSPQLLARDGDKGINAIINYKLDSVVPAALNIVINSTTGELNFLSQLDRENISEYTVTVMAFQVDNHLMSTNAKVIVIVDDVNDNRPDFVYPSSNIHINEDSPNGLLVVPLTVKDIDQGDNSKVNFVIKTDDLNAFGLKYDNLTSTTWLTVKNSTALHGKEIAHIKLELREVTEVYGVPCDYLTTCIANLTVYIDDINDNTPVFSQRFYMFSVYNGNQSGDLVGKIIANDSDRGENANITYSFSLVTSDLFCNQLMLNSVTGEFTLKSSMMPETICYLLATACDNPVDKFLQRCQTVSVTVQFYSGGSNSTAFSEYNVTELENVPVSSPVTVLPVKVDGLRSNSTDFYVQQNILYTNINLDRERKDIYHVLFFNKDDLLVFRINVQVEDVNDNPPLFLQDIYNITLKYDIQIGQVLIQVNATDADLNDNARLKYFLLSGREYFSIDENTGKIKLINIPTSKDVNGLDYTIVVTDMGIPPLRATALLKVYNPNINETLYVVIPIERNKLITEIEGVKRKLESILGVKITVLNIESVPDFTTMGSRVYITATNSQGIPIDDFELNRLLKSNAEEIYSTFHQADGTKSDVYWAPFIAVLVISIVLLMVLLITLILLCRKQKKIERQKQLFEKLNKDTTIYDSTRTHAGNGANATQNVANYNYENIDSNHTSIQTVFENPIFVPDTDRPNNIQNDPNSSNENSKLQKKINEPENSVTESKVTPSLQDFKINSLEESNSIENSPVESRHKWYRRHSETDSGVPGIGENFEENEADENDNEVANILTHDQVDSFTHSKTDKSALSSPSIMQNSDPNIEEPEPDYAKKVHFLEELNNIHHGLNKETDSEMSNKDRVDEEIHIPNSDIEGQFYFGATEITAL